MPLRSLALIRLIPVLALAGLTLQASGPGFRTRHLLEEAFAKYGHDFGNISQEQYLKMAQQLRDARSGRNILEMPRREGGGMRFDRRSGAFVAWNADRTIRLFFMPKDGERYFHRQRDAEQPEK